MKRISALAGFLRVVVARVGIVGFGAGKVAVVLDVGGRGDLSFNDMGFKGTDQAAIDFDLEMTEVQSATAADYSPNLRNLSRTGEYDLIIGVGFLFTDAMAEVAAEFPDQKFAIIDSFVDAPNVMSIVFRENEMSALIGALAAMSAAYHGCSAAGVVLGIEIPVLYHFEAGFRFGMDWGLKKYVECFGETAEVSLLYTYTGSFSDIALGKAASEAMLAQGACSIYNVAGPLGLGDLEAVTEFHDNAGTTSGPPYYFGVDANQDYLGNGLHGLASGMKRVDQATYLAVEAVVNGTFVGGLTSFGLTEGGVGISKLQDLVDFIDFGVAGGVVDACDFYEILANWANNRATLPCCIWDAIDELEAGILDGMIIVPTADTLAEMSDVRELFTLGAP
jgi:basic membrane protein A